MTPAQHAAAEAAMEIIKTCGFSAVESEPLEQAFFRGCEYGRMNPFPTAEVKVRIRNLVLTEIQDELMKALENWPPHNSAHEAYAVLLEEVDELWEHVKTNQKRRDIVGMRKECIQVAAMAARFAVECCEPGGNGYGK